MRVAHPGRVRPTTVAAFAAIAALAAGGSWFGARSSSTRAARPAASSEEPATLAEQRQRLLRRMQAELALTDLETQRVERIFSASTVLGQGNPALTRHPMTRDECLRIRAAAGLVAPAPNACGAANMAPLFDPTAGETAADAEVCIDRFEFPNIACEYPVVFVTAREAALLCEAVGKRICDAHEWEGACAGAVHDPAVEYEFGLPRAEARQRHNRAREIVWAYGPTKDHALCATASERTPGCHGGFWSRCGSNTYPAGAFPACQSPFGVFDLHGNAAEHMNLPLEPDQLARRGGSGSTEMKGSWFIFSTFEAHPDDCRWRAPNWHGSRLMSPSSHLNYHLGFRCCKDVARP
jgi:sulfatase-modifying factor enzyme 1